MTKRKSPSEAAEAAGYEAGKAAGSWVLDGNSTAEEASRILQGIEDGDPEIMDSLPSSPLSGEWAGDPTPADILRDFSETDDDPALDDDILSAYENGYAQGVMDEVVRSAVAIGGVVQGAPIREGYPHPIAYTYEAAYHCPQCAARRFGTDDNGFPPASARDNEGNPIGAVAPWDEWEEYAESFPQVLTCATCGAEIARNDGEGVDA